MQTFLNPGFKSLHFAARPAVVAHYLGNILAAFAVLSVVPAAVSLVDGNVDVAARYGFMILAAGAAGGGALRLNVTRDLQRNEAMVVSALTFIVTPLLLTVPMTGYGLGFVDALFETVSGVTTTGLSVLPTVEDMPAAFHFSRAWMQWIGGLGVVVLVLALLIEPSTAAS